MSKLGAWLRKLFHPDRKIVVPTPGPFDDSGVYIAVEHVKQIITDTLGSRMQGRSHIHLSEDRKSVV